MRKTLTAALVAALTLTIVAGPAAARPGPPVPRPVPCTRWIVYTDLKGWPQQTCLSALGLTMSKIRPL